MPRPNFGAHGAPQKAKDMKKSFSRLLRYLKAYLPLIIVSMVLIIAQTVFRIIGPDKLADITNIVTETVMVPGATIDLSGVWKIATLLICLYVFGAVFSYIANVIIVRVCFKMSQNLRSEIDNKHKNFKKCNGYHLHKCALADKDENE